MIKQYFKKILFTLGSIANYFLLMFILVFIFHSVLGKVFSELVTTLIYALLALIIDLVIVCIIRYRSLRIKADTQNTPSFFHIIKSSDNIAHTLAFISVLLPFFVFIAVVENTPLLPAFFATIILLCILGLIFLAVNALMWFIVYKTYVHKSIRVNN